MPSPYAASAAALHWALPALAWLGGLALLQQCQRLPSAGELAGLLLALLVLLVVAWRRSLIALVCAAALLAFVQGAWRSELRLAEALPQAWEGRDLLLTGRIDSLPSAILGQGGAPGWRFEFLLDEAHAGPSPRDPLLALPRRLLMLAYGPPGGEAPRLRAGERWQWQARLKRPHGLINPHAFDYELWMFEQNLRATGVVRPDGMRRLDEAPAWSVDALRQRLRDALNRSVSDPGRAGVLAALSLGDQAAIAKDDWALFRDTGVAHLLSVSGTHVTMFAWAMQWFVSLLWRRSARLCLLCPSPRAALWAGVLAALAYALFSGWGVPAQRTVWMLTSLALLREFGLRWPWPLCLLFAALVVTVVDPWAISQAGFWLSFAAVALLMASGTPSGKGFKALVQEGLRSQWTATFGLAPLSLLFFQQISVVGLLANLLAIPLVTFVIAPLALAGALLPGLWLAAEACVQGLMAYLHALAGLSWAVWILPVAPWWAQIAGLAGGALLVLPLPWRLRLCGFALLAPLLWPAPARPRDGEFELLAADVGQGTAVLLRTATHDLLYDTGPQYGPMADAGQRVLLPLLRNLGVMRLDVLMLSHRDMDHVGGAASLMAGLPVALLRSSLEEGHALLTVPHERCVQGQRWAWDGVQFELLHPLPADYGAGAKSNALSCVLRVSDAAGRSALLAGDIEAPQEQRLAPGMPRSDFMLVPHHGSKTSSTDVLLYAVSPQLALAQAGYRNRFGHPALPVLARYQAHGIQLITSADCGALSWRSRDGEWQCQRERGKRYWHAPPASRAILQGPGLENEKGQPEGWP